MSVTTSTRHESKPPAKFDDCFLGEDCDDLFVENKNAEFPIESPIVHRQVDGRMNNVSFRTFPNRVENWKKTMMEYFSPNKPTVLKSGKVMKII